MAAEKHDVFVGNLAFNTTEEQLHEIFIVVGMITISYNKSYRS